MSFEAITAADLFATSTKKRSQDARQHFIAIGRVAEHDQIRRHLDTCQSKVFSLAEVDALWKICHPRHHCWVTWGCASTVSVILWTQAKCSSPTTRTLDGKS